MRDSLLPPDYEPRGDVPGECTLAGEGGGYFDMVSQVPVVYAGSSDTQVADAISEHELTHRLLASSGYMGFFVRFFGEFADLSRDARASNWGVLGRVLHSASVFVHEAVATYCEIEALRVDHKYGAEEMAAYLRRLPPFYRRAFSAIHSVLSGVPTPTRDSIIATEEVLADDLSTRNQRLCYVGLMLTCEMRWKARLARHAGMLALSLDLRELLHRGCLTSEPRLRLALLQRDHNPTSRLKLILARLSGHDVHEYYQGQFRAYARRVSEAARHREVHAVVRDPRMRYIRELSLADVYTLLSPFGVARPCTAEDVRTLAGELGCLFAEGTTDRAWWESRASLISDGCGDFPMEAVDLTDAAVVPRPLDVRGVRSQPPLLEPTEAYTHLRVTEVESLRPRVATKDALLVQFDQYPVHPAEHVRTTQMRIVSPRECMQLLEVYRGRTTNAVIDIDVLDRLGGIASLKATGEDPLPSVLFAGPASLLDVGRLAGAFDRRWGSPACLYNLGGLGSTSSRVVAAVAVSETHPALWTVVGPRLIAAMDSWNGLDHGCHTEGTDLWMRSVGEWVVDAALHLFLIDEYFVEVWQKDGVRSYATPTWEGTLDRI